MWKKKSLGGCGGGLSALSLLLCCQAEVASPFQASLSSSLKMQAGMGMGMLKGLRPKKRIFAQLLLKNLGSFSFRRQLFGDTGTAIGIRIMWNRWDRGGTSLRNISAAGVHSDSRLMGQWALRGFSGLFCLWCLWVCLARLL